MQYVNALCPLIAGEWGLWPRGVIWGIFGQGVLKGGLWPREVILGIFGKIRNFNPHKWSATAMKQTRHAT